MANLLAGRDLDALIAEKVMGWINCDPVARWDAYAYGDPGDEWTRTSEEWCRGLGVAPHSQSFSFHADYKRPFPRYSQSIVAAWLLVDRLKELGWSMGLDFDLDGEADVSFMHWVKESVLGGDYLTDGKSVSVIADTAPLAICLAALNAVTPSPVEVSDG